MNAALYTVLRYLVTAGSAALAQHGWTIASADGATLDAVTQLMIGVAGVVIPAIIGVLTSTVRWTVARLKARHATALVAAAADVPGVQQIQAVPALASAIPSTKVVAP